MIEVTGKLHSFNINTRRPDNMDALPIDRYESQGVRMTDSERQGGFVPAQPPDEEDLQRLIYTPGVSMLRGAIRQSQSMRDRGLGRSTANMSRQEIERTTAEMETIVNF